MLAARLYGEAGASALVYALDNIQQSQSRDCVLSLVNLVLVTGNLGKPGAGIYPMRPGANEQGASDVGCVPDRLPGYRRVSSMEDREALELLWDTSIPEMPGLGLAKIVEAAAAGEVKSLFLIGDSANFSNGKLGDGLAALDNLEFLVVCDTTNNTADVIDRNEFVAELFIKPARSINYVTVTFTATRTGVSFAEVVGR